jgi:hypothetical protein
VTAVSSRSMVTVFVVTDVVIPVSPLNVNTSESKSIASVPESPAISKS